MAQLSNNAEGGASGATVLAADTGSGDPWTTVTGPGTAGIVQYQNALVANGGLGYKIATRGTAEQETLAWLASAAAATYFGRVYVSVDVITATAQFFSAKQSAAGGTLGFLGWDTTSPSKLSIRNGSNSVSQYTSTASLTLGTIYRVEYTATAGNGGTGGTLGTGVGTMQFRLYLGNSNTLIEDSGQVNVTQSTAFTTWQYVRHGVPTSVANVPSTTGFIYLDDIVAFATTWPGSAAAATQFGRPSSDVATGGWAPSTGTTVFGVIDETPASDTDFVSQVAS